MQNSTGKAREESAGDSGLTQVGLSDMEWTEAACGAAGGRTASSYEQRQRGVSKPERERKREGAWGDFTNSTRSSGSAYDGNGAARQARRWRAPSRRDLNSALGLWLPGGLLQGLVGAARCGWPVFITGKTWEARQGQDVATANADSAMEFDVGTSWSRETADKRGRSVSETEGGGKRELRCWAGAL